MKKKLINLPKGYLSYSQVQLWNNDRNRYTEIYFNSRDDLRVSNAGMDYGKVVAEALEKEKETDIEDILTHTAVSLLPKYDVRDQEIEVEWKSKDGWLKIIGRPDMLDSKTFNFREIKTGKTKWTSGKAQKHLQMRWYAMLIYIKHKKVLHEAYLDWIETENTDEGIKPTGRVESFKVVFSLSDILSTMALAMKTAKEIEIAYASHVVTDNKPF